MSLSHSRSSWNEWNQNLLRITWDSNGDKCGQVWVKALLISFFLSQIVGRFFICVQWPYCTCFTYDFTAHLNLPFVPPSSMLHFIFFFALFRAATLFALEFIELSLKCVNYSILSSELRNSARLCRSLAKQWKIMGEKEAVNGAVFVEKVINIKHSPHWLKLITLDRPTFRCVTGTILMLLNLFSRSAADGVTVCLL